MAQMANVAAPLTLNGAGLRTRLFIKIYVGALYLSEKKTCAEAVLADIGAKRMECTPFTP